MPKITVSVEDIKSTLTMEAGWKPGTLISVIHEPSSKKDSMNYMFEFALENEPGDVRKLKHCVNDKNRKMLIIGMIQLYEAFYAVEVDPAKSFDIEPETWLTLTCWVEVATEMYQNRPQNKITGFSSKRPF